jgi:uncharacterized protein (DUF2147 family)
MTTLNRSARCLATAVALAFALPSLADSASPVGRWRTVDDATGKARSVVEIVETDGELQGRILQLIDPPGGNMNPLCKKCEGERKDQPVVGMTFLWGLKHDDGQWSGGSILDPNNGKIYRAKASLIDGGSKLEVRGFIGISLIGRTQVWLREEQ